MEEVWAGDLLLVFDGRVFEVFGYPASGATRFHVRNLVMSADGPDRKGRHLIQIRAATGRGGALAFHVEESDWPTVGPFLDRVMAAVPAA